MTAQTADQLHTRAAQLRSDLETAHDQLELAQGDFASGDGSFEQIAVAQSKVTGLTGALRIAEQRALAQAELEAEQAAQRQRQGQIQSAIAGATEAAEGRDQLHALAHEATAYLGPMLAQMTEALRKQSAGRRRFIAATTQVEPSLKKRAWSGQGHLVTPETRAADTRLEALLALISSEVDINAALTPLTANGPETSRDLPLATLPAPTKLHSEVWQLWLRTLLSQGATVLPHATIETPPNQS